LLHGSCHFHLRSNVINLASQIPLESVLRLISRHGQLICNMLAFHVHKSSRLSSIARPRRSVSSRPRPRTVSTCEFRNPHLNPANHAHAHAHYHHYHNRHVPSPNSTISPPSFPFSLSALNQFFFQVAAQNQNCKFPSDGLKIKKTLAHSSLSTANVIV